MTLSIIIAVCSLFIAILSVIFSIITIFQTRKHNQLTVRPFLQIVPEDVDGILSVHLFNAGIGPAVRGSLIVTKGKCVSQHLVDHMPPDINWDTYSKFENYVIPSNHSEPLLVLTGNQADTEFCNEQNKARYVLKDINIKCSYKDVYGAEFSVEQSLNNCFGRHFKNDEMSNVTQS